MRRRLLFLAALVLAVAAGVASASALVGTSGDQDADPLSRALEPDGSGARVVPAEDTASAERAAGPAWAVRVYRSRTGLTCPEAGRLQDGDFGQVDAAGAFHPTAIAASGSCADLTAAPLAVAVNHYADDTGTATHAAIFGATTADVQRLTLQLSSGDREVPISSDTYLAVTTEDELLGASLEATLQDGTTERFPLRPNDLPAVERPEGP